MEFSATAAARAVATSTGSASVALVVAAEALSYVPSATPAPPASRTITITRQEHALPYVRAEAHGTYSRAAVELAPFARANVWLRPRVEVAVDARRAEHAVRVLP